MNRPQQHEPAPHAYTILSEGGRIDAPPLAARPHDRLLDGRITGSIGLRITTVSPLHVGSGVSNVAYREGQPFLGREIIFQREGDRDVPVIPGSSIKGAVRSLMEAFGGGCQFDRKLCDPPCRACGLFGHLLAKGGYLARVSFDDARPECAEDEERVGWADGPVPWEPDKRHPKGRRIYGKPPRYEDKPVPYAVVHQGVPFAARLFVRNVTSDELGLVLLAIGSDHTFEPRLGGGKFVGFGRVRVDLVGASLRRGYATLAPVTLDADAARALGSEAMVAAEKGLTPKGAAVLTAIRAVLGGGP